jgi:hypothetical protein
MLGYPNLALNSAQEALRQAHDLAHPFTLAVTLYAIATVYLFRREVQAVASPRRPSWCSHANRDSVLGGHSHGVAGLDPGHTGTGRSGKGAGAPDVAIDRGRTLGSSCAMSTADGIVKARPASPGCYPGSAAVSAIPSRPSSRRSRTIAYCRRGPDATQAYARRNARRSHDHPRGRGCRHRLQGPDRPNNSHGQPPADAVGQPAGHRSAHGRPERREHEKQPAGGDSPRRETR